MYIYTFQYQSLVGMFYYILYDQYLKLCLEQTNTKDITENHENWP